MQEAIIVIVAAVIAIAGFISYKRYTKGSSCCGELEKAEKSISVKGRKKSEYPYKTELSISGMTCINCARRIENALNRSEDILAKVDLGKNLAYIRTKNEPDVKKLCSTIAEAGYGAKLKR